jgi:hypothetical protein
VPFSSRRAKVGRCSASTEVLPRSRVRGSRRERLFCGCSVEVDDGGPNPRIWPVRPCIIDADRATGRASAGSLKDSAGPFPYRLWRRGKNPRDLAPGWVSPFRLKVEAILSLHYADSRRVSAVQIARRLCYGHPDLRSPVGPDRHTAAVRPLAQSVATYVAGIAAAGARGTASGLLVPHGLLPCEGDAHKPVTPPLRGRLPYPCHGPKVSLIVHHSYVKSRPNYKDFSLN